MLARKSATPHLNPTITLSEMKFTIEPAFASHATKAMSATSKAVLAASALNRVVSPPEISPSDAPMSREMADVTVIVGGIIPDDDIPALKAAGVTEVFGPGALTSDIVEVIHSAVGNGGHGNSRA